MIKATEICAAVKEALAVGRTVYITDATETRKVVGIEFLAATSYHKFDEQSLVILVDYGDGEVKPWGIMVPWPDELIGWALEELVGGSLFIAPEWWFTERWFII